MVLFDNFKRETRAIFQKQDSNDFRSSLAAIYDARKRLISLTGIELLWNISAK